jgi:fatty acid desaturase
MFATDRLGALFFLFDVIILSLSIYLSSLGDTYFWVIGQFLMFIFCWHCFTTLHSCGHNSHFRSKRLNQLVGHFVSCFVWTPLESWRILHNLHHKWTGNPYKDPTLGTSNAKPPSLITAVVNFLWKIGFPIVSIFFTFSVFYNPQTYKKVGARPDLLRHIYFASFVILILHLYFIIFQPSLYFHYYFPGFFVYLVVGDIVIISNHAHIEMPGKGEDKFSPKEQGLYSRDLIFSKWVSLFVFYNFNFHSYHHLYPSMPFYRMKYRDMVGDPAPRKKCHWLKWVIKTKKMSLSDLINKSYMDI